MLAYRVGVDVTTRREPGRRVSLTKEELLKVDKGCVLLTASEDHPALVNRRSAEP